MPRVLLTGATGFIGSRLLSLLLKEGWQVVGLVHTRPLAEELQLPGVEVYVGDILSKGSLAAVPGPIDAICHCAAYVPKDHRNPNAAERCMQVNAIGTLNLLLFAEEHDVARFVYSSTAAVYAPSREDLITESYPTYPFHKATFYAASKLAGELFVEHYRQTRGLQTVSLRYSSVYGPGMRSREVVARFMVRAAAGMSLEVLNGGMASADFVYVDDVAWTTVRALSEGNSGIYNVGSGRSTTILELAHSIAEVYHDHGVQVHLLPPQENYCVSPAAALDITKARMAWGFKPKPLKMGLCAYRQAMDECHKTKHPPEMTGGEI